MRPSLWMYLWFVLIFINTNGQSQTHNDERILRVKGVAILKQMPELISIAINIKIESKEYSDCNDRVITALRKAKEIFINNGIEKDLIKTTDLRVSESKVYKNGEEIKVGFVGSVSLAIETTYSIDFTKKILVSLKTDLIPFNYNISFKLSEAQKDSLRKKAISKAIDDAKEKAILIAASSKVRLDRINSIVYKDDSFVSGTNDSDIIKEYSWESVYFSYSIRGAGSNTPSTDFNPKEIRIIKAVEIEWLINDLN